MIEFSKKYSLTNGNKINKKNWHKVYAIKTNPCTNILGVPQIEDVKRKKGEYFCKYYIKFDKEKGYGFFEQYAKTGISGWHKTVREAIFYAIRRDIKVFLNE